MSDREHRDDREREHEHDREHSPPHGNSERRRSLSASPSAGVASAAQESKLIESVSSGEDREIVQLGDDEVAFVLGRGGATKNKLARVARCRLEMDSHGRLEIIGAEANRVKAKRYVGLVLAQRIGPVYIDARECPDDISTIRVPSNCVAYITGRSGIALRSNEEECGCLMFFARDKAAQPGYEKEEVLAIFGDKRARCQAELKVMSSIEHKMPRYFVENGKLRVPFSHYNDGEQFVVETQMLMDDDFSYALGRGGVTRRKLARAAGCIIQYVGQLAVFAGTRNEVDNALQYLKWLLQQRVGAVIVDQTNRTDLTVIPVSAKVVGYITGARGVSLRDVEERSGTFCFTEGDKNERHSPTSTENVIVLATNAESRKIAERIILDRIRLKTADDEYRERKTRDRSRSPRNRDRSPPRRERSPVRRRSRSPPRSYRASSPVSSYGSYYRGLPPPHQPYYPSSAMMSSYARPRSPPRYRERSPDRSRDRRRSRSRERSLR